MTKLVAFLAQHAYLLLFITVFVEQIGLPIPAAPMLLAAGAYAKTGQMNLPCRSRSRHLRRCWQIFAGTKLGGGAG